MNIQSAKSYLETPHGQIFLSKVTERIAANDTMDEAILFATNYVNSLLNELLDGKTERAKFFKNDVASKAINILN